MEAFLILAATISIEPKSPRPDAENVLSTSATPGNRPEKAGPVHLVAALCPPLFWGGGVQGVPRRRRDATARPMLPPKDD